jgi:hypothetical protein
MRTKAITKWMHSTGNSKAEEGISEERQRQTFELIWELVRECMGAYEGKRRTIETTFFAALSLHSS